MRRAAILALALLLPTLAGCPRATRAGPPADLRDHLPEESVGPTAFDRAALDGNATLILFFATFCLPCLGQLGLANGLHEAYAEQGLRVVVVGMDLDGRRVLAPFAEVYAPDVPVLVADEPLRAGRTPYGPVQVVPYTVILDRRGRVVVAWPGVAEVKDVREQVERALKR